MSRPHILLVALLAALLAACTTPGAAPTATPSPTDTPVPPTPTPIPTRVPAAATTPSPGPRVLISVAGLDSSASCAATATDRNALTRLATLAAAVQTTASPVAATIALSYSGQWQDCATGQRYDASTYPVGAGAAIAPVYKATDTCVGVVQAATVLGNLAARILERQPQARLVLVGHSLGGLVVDYFAATATAGVAARIDSAISVDSPLLGVDLARVPPQLRDALKGLCPLTSQSWLDLGTGSAVVQRLQQVSGSSMASHVYAIEATPIGQAIPGTLEWRASCARFGGAFGIGHSCPFSDPASLAHIGAAANGGPLDDFRLTVAP